MRCNLAQGLFDRGSVPALLTQPFSLVRDRFRRVSRAGSYEVHYVPGASVRARWIVAALMMYVLFQPPLPSPADRYASSPAVIALLVVFNGPLHPLPGGTDSVRPRHGGPGVTADLRRVATGQRQGRACCRHIPKPNPSWDLHFGCVANWPGNPVRNLRRWLSPRCVNSEGTQFNITGTARAIPQSPHARAPSTCLANKQPQFRRLHLPGQPQYRQCYKTDL